LKNNTALIRCDKAVLLQGKPEARSELLEIDS